MVEATLETVDDYHLHECSVLAVPRHEVADELVVRHVLNVVHVKSNCVFLNASSRVALLPLSALNHASVSASSKLPQWVCRRESRSCCVMCLGFEREVCSTIRFLRHGFGSCVCPARSRSLHCPTTRRGRQVPPSHGRQRSLRLAVP